MTAQLEHVLVLRNNAAGPVSQRCTVERTCERHSRAVLTSIAEGGVAASTIPQVPLSAFIDESGGRAHTRESTDHFVMTAVVFHESNQPKVRELLAQLRSDLGRRQGDVLH